MLWVFQALGWPCTEQSGAVELVVPESERGHFGNSEICHFSLRNGVSAIEQPVLTLQSPAVTWLRHRMGEQVVHARPEGQPSGVHEISGQLFATYRFDGGTVRLGGCTLEQRPIVRMTRWDDEGAEVQLRHRSSTPNGEEVDQQFAVALGLDRIVLHSKPPKLAGQDLARWQEAALQSGGGKLANCVTTLIWCMHAEGKIEFEAKGVSESVSFSDWAKPLLDGVSAPPPFRCPHTGDTSFEVAVTDDGRISTKSMIAVCEVSERRVLATDLESCSVTGKRASRELLSRCPVSEEHVLPQEMVSCSMCQQSVGSHVLRDDRCQACRNLRRVSKDDPRMARILGEHPNLDRWRRWRMAETELVYIVCSSSFVRRFLFVVDKTSLELLRLAVGSRISTRWSDAPPADRQEYT